MIDPPPRRVRLRLRRSDMGDTTAEASHPQPRGTRRRARPSPGRPSAPREEGDPLDEDARDCVGLDTRIWSMADNARTGLRAVTALERNNDVLGRRTAGAADFGLVALVFALVAAATAEVGNVGSKHERGQTEAAQEAPTAAKGRPPPRSATVQGRQASRGSEAKVAYIGRVRISEVDPVPAVGRPRRSPDADVDGPQNPEPELRGADVSKDASKKPRKPPPRPKEVPKPPPRNVREGNVKSGDRTSRGD